MAKLGRTKLTSKAQDFRMCAMPRWTPRGRKLLRYQYIDIDIDIDIHERLVPYYMPQSLHGQIFHLQFPVSRLTTNPSTRHHAAADRVLNYLARYRYFALQFSGEDDFIVASDASFADDSMDRKSSQAYVLKLCDGTIGWRANKQNEYFYYVYN